MLNKKPSAKSRRLYIKPNPLPVYTRGSTGLGHEGERFFKTAFYILPDN